MGKLESPQQLKLDFGGGPEVTDGLQQAVDENQSDDTVEDVVTVPAHDQRPKTKDQRPKTKEERRKKKRSDSLPDLPDNDTVCDTHGDKTLIGYDTTETLTYTPPKLDFIFTKYPKYACPNQPECGVRQLPRPESLIEGNRYDTSVAAKIITAKYGCHPPYYRQQDLFTGSGWTPFRSTLLNILTAAASVIRPLVDYFADEVRTDKVIGTDDTGVTLLLPEIDPNDVRSQRIHEVFSKAIAEDKKHVKAKMWVCTGPAQFR